jgi:hypothetical protein
VMAPPYTTDFAVITRIQRHAGSAGTVS